MLIPPNKPNYNASPPGSPAPSTHNYDTLSRIVLKKILDTSRSIHIQEVKNILLQNAPPEGNKEKLKKSGIEMFSKAEIGNSAERYIEHEVDITTKGARPAYSYEDIEHTKNILCEIFIQDYYDELIEHLLPLAKELYFTLKE